MISFFHSFSSLGGVFSTAGFFWKMLPENLGDKLMQWVDRTAFWDIIIKMRQETRGRLIFGTTLLVGTMLLAACGEKPVETVTPKPTGPSTSINPSTETFREIPGAHRLPACDGRDAELALTATLIPDSDPQKVWVSYIKNTLPPFEMDLRQWQSEEVRRKTIQEAVIFGDNYILGENLGSLRPLSPEIMPKDGGTSEGSDFLNRLYGLSKLFTREEIPNISYVRYDTCPLLSGWQYVQYQNLKLFSTHQFVNSQGGIAKNVEVTAHKLTKSKFGDFIEFFAYKNSKTNEWGILLVSPTKSTPVHYGVPGETPNVVAVNMTIEPPEGFNELQQIGLNKWTYDVQTKRIRFNTPPPDFSNITQLYNKVHEALGLKSKLPYDINELYGVYESVIPDVSNVVWDKWPLTKCLQSLCNGLSCRGLKSEDVSKCYPDYHK